MKKWKNLPLRGHPVLSAPNIRKSLKYRWLSRKTRAVSWQSGQMTVSVNAYSLLSTHLTFLHERKYQICITMLYIRHHYWETSEIYNACNFQIICPTMSGFDRKRWGNTLYDLCRELSSKHSPMAS